MEFEYFLSQISHPVCPAFKTWQRFDLTNGRAVSLHLDHSNSLLTGFPVSELAVLIPPPHGSHSYPFCSSSQSPVAHLLLAKAYQSLEICNPPLCAPFFPLSPSLTPLQPRGSSQVPGPSCLRAFALAMPSVGTALSQDSKCLPSSPPSGLCSSVTYLARPSLPTPSKTGTHTHTHTVFLHTSFPDFVFQSIYPHKSTFFEDRDFCVFFTMCRSL